MIKKVEQVIKEAEYLKGQRGNWETQWQEIADYMMPRKNDINTFLAPGSKRNTQILDNTGQVSLELLAGVLHGLLTSATSNFFDLTTGNDALDNRDDVRRWVEKVVEIMHTQINNTNFQTEAHEFYMDLCGLCTAAITILEDKEKDFVFKSHFLKEIYIRENSKGIVDQIYRIYDWEARKIVEDYGIKNVPDCVREAFEGNKPEEKFQIIHHTYPAYELGEKRKGFRFPIVSQHILVKEKYELKLEGFNENPWIVARWAKASGEDYGRGPGVNALPEVKMVNLMEETMIKSAQKIIDPPMQAPDDGFVLPIKTRPGSINFYRSGSNRTDRIEPIFNNQRIDFGFEIMESRRKRIKEGFYVDQLQTGELDRATTVEVMTKNDEKMRFLGPLLGRLQVEFLSPMVDRIFAIMLRKNRFPPPPPSIQGMLLKVRFSSAIARMQKMTQANSTMQFLGAGVQLAQIDPSVLDNLDANAAYRGIASWFSFPQKFLKDQDAVDEMRQQKAQQQAEMAEIAKNQADSQTIKNITPAMQAAQQMDPEQMEEEV